MTEQDRRKVIKEISKRVNQIIVLSNHIKNGKTEHIDNAYLDEKLDSYPVLDSETIVTRAEIGRVLLGKYDVDIEEW